MKNKTISLTTFIVASLVCLFLFSAKAKATHIVSYDGYVKCVGRRSNSIGLEVHITLYSNSQMSTIPFDGAIDVGLYKRDDLNLQSKYSIAMVAQQQLDDKHPFWSRFSKADYLQTIWIPINASGYTLSYQRCCIGYSNNFYDNQGFDLRIEIPGDIAERTETPRFDSLPIYLLQRAVTHTFPHSIEMGMYTSGRVRSGFFYRGASNDDPLPQPTLQIDPPLLSVFNTGYNASNPLGLQNNCDFISHPDSHTIRIDQKGLFVLPVHAQFIHNGDTFVYNRIINVTVVDTLFGSLNLSFVSSDHREIVLSSDIIDWVNSPLVELQRSNNISFSQYTTVMTQVPNGKNVIVSDTQVMANTSYFYRLHMGDSRYDVYSNIVQANLVGLNVSGISSTGFRIYPNPSAGLFTVSSLQETAFRVCDPTGAEVYNGLLPAGETEVDLKHLAPGIYFIRSGNGVMQKLVITDF